MNKDISQFLLLVSGQVNKALFPNSNDVCVRLSFSHGSDWTRISQQSDLISASCYKGTNDEQTIGLSFQETFSSTSAYKWPQILLTCYSRDRRGNDVILGYGSTHLPSTPGKFNLRIPCFAPEPSSYIQHILALVRGKRPEFVDASIITTNEGRKVTRVSTQGIIHVNVSVVLKDTAKQGLEIAPLIGQQTNDFSLNKIDQVYREQRTLPNLTEENPSID